MLYYTRGHIPSLPGSGDGLDKIVQHHTTRPRLIPATEATNDTCAPDRVENTISK